MFNAALRAAVEHYALRAAGTPTAGTRADGTRADGATARAELAEAVRSALDVASQGLT